MGLEKKKECSGLTMQLMATPIYSRTPTLAPQILVGKLVLF